ncbi:MAG TPA: dihydroorotate dehydrogenase electron transfer subunit [Acetivibrio sp.]|uniref:dihydroorotate dehydrogenase electron transfer subunit n=1 Tax=Acetivibrio sp. TaxID=1872092 RepID=UPI002CFD25EB|nr:dihydroorotate dehydrogenase electron transfer subunit [Acetivibrio sp.]HOM03024.1 dihydroorotate dehydrogenase electron transfer subunit [Acetivibrio sp.]
MSKVLKEKIESIEKIAKSIYKMTVKSEYISENARPGQFVNVKCCEGLNALLRRPISICSVDRERGTFDIVFQIKGIGTEYLSQKQAGSEVDLIGPLGKPFHVSDQYKRIAVVGGGIGIFPLLYLLKEMKDADKSAFLGFRSSDYVVLTDEFEAAADKLSISTDDGSVGYKGLVTDLLDKDIAEKGFDIIYTCGPLPMIRKVKDMAQKAGIKCQVSLEQRMGCGIGACLVCACKTGKPDNWEYSHVCKDGPVFWSDEVILDD